MVRVLPMLTVLRCIWFAGPNPHDIAIARRDRDCADRLHRLFVENCIKRHTVISGLEQPASRESHEKNRGIARINRDVAHPTAHRRRPNRPRLEILEENVGQFWRRRLCHRRSSEGEVGVVSDDAAGEAVVAPGRAPIRAGDGVCAWRATMQPKLMKGMAVDLIDTISRINRIRSRSNFLCNPEQSCKSRLSPVSVAADRG